MSFSRLFSVTGALVGLGFGIFSSAKNFNPDMHQSQEMTESTRFFSELLTQIAMVGLQSTSLSFLGAIAGLVADLVTCFKFVSSDTDHEKTYLLKGIV